MQRRPLSVAQMAVIAGIASMLLMLSDAVFVSPGFVHVLKSAMAGNTDAAAALVTFFAFLALLYPVLRGRRWSYVLAPIVLLVMVIPVIKTFFFGGLIAQPLMVGLFKWMLVVASGVLSLTGIGFGVIALLEFWGKRTPASFWIEGAGMTRQGAVVAGVGGLLAGMLTLGSVVAAVPVSGSALAQKPDAIAYVSLKNYSFDPPTLTLQAEKATAIFLTNDSELPHNYRVDGLGINVDVPRGLTQVVMVKPIAAGSYEVVCDYSGHHQLGMAGTVDVK